MLNDGKKLEFIAPMSVAHSIVYAEHAFSTNLHRLAYAATFMG